VSAAELFKQVQRLPLAERVQFANQLWENISDERHDPDLTKEQMAELDRRAERALAHPEKCRPLDEAIADIEARFRAAQ